MNELLISSAEDGVRIAILEDRKLIELHQEMGSKKFSVGDVFLAKVGKLVPGLNAAFVDVGHEKDAFLHYLDVGPQIQSWQKYLRIVHSSETQAKAHETLDFFKPENDIDKTGKIGQVFKSGDRVLVQIVKEPISTKGPRLSCEISIPGQYLILVPFSKDVSVSRKIKSAEDKRRLKAAVESICPAGFGIILRTAAEGKDLLTLKADLDMLMEKWTRMNRAIPNAVPPTKVLHEEDKTTSILRDMLSIGFDAVVTDDEDIYQDVVSYLKGSQAQLAKNCRLYKNARQSLFDSYGIEKQIKATFGKTVTFTSGSYLVIEHTEAMHVIDVNSGSKHLNNASLEDNALKVNMDAAREIARQLRLRDMGGIIVIDFIDLKKPENRKALFDHLKECMKRDRAKHTILPMSKFGLIQITRQRVRPEISVATTETCPSCRGTGKILPSILLVDEVAGNLDFIFKQDRNTQLTLKVNPFLQAYLNRGFPSLHFKWMWRYKKTFRILADSSLPFTQVKYFNMDEEIKFD